jgi:ABC-type transporter Mla MlaB component
MGVPLPRPEPGTIVVGIGGPLARADVSALCVRVRDLLERSGAGVVVCEVGARAHPDAVTVDALARLQVTALRLGRSVRLRNVSGELQDLLDLMGLGDIVPPCTPLRRRLRGQTEQREQSVGVEEERHPADPIV